MPKYSRSNDYHKIGANPSGNFETDEEGRVTDDTLEEYQEGWLKRKREARQEDNDTLNIPTGLD